MKHILSKPYNEEEILKRIISEISKEKKAEDCVVPAIIFIDFLKKIENKSYLNQIVEFGVSKINEITDFYKKNSLFLKIAGIIFNIDMKFSISLIDEVVFNLFEELQKNKSKFHDNNEKNKFIRLFDLMIVEICNFTLYYKDLQFIEKAQELVEKFKNKLRTNAKTLPNFQGHIIHFLLVILSVLLKIKNVEKSKEIIIIIEEAFDEKYKDFLYNNEERFFKLIAELAISTEDEYFIGKLSRKLNKIKVRSEDNDFNKQKFLKSSIEIAVIKFKYGRRTEAYEQFEYIIKNIKGLFDIKFQSDLLSAVIEKIYKIYNKENIYKILEELIRNLEIMLKSSSNEFKSYGSSDNIDNSSIKIINILNNCAFFYKDSKMLCRLYQILKKYKYGFLEISKSRITLNIARIGFTTGNLNLINYSLKIINNEEINTFWIYVSILLPIFEVYIKKDEKKSMKIYKKILSKIKNKNNINLLYSGLCRLTKFLSNFKNKNSIDLPLFEKITSLFIAKIKKLNDFKGREKILGDIIIILLDSDLTEDSKLFKLAIELFDDLTDTSIRILVLFKIIEKINKEFQKIERNNH
ncbi:MAG: hypothetical protein ACTSRG_01780 [Candidatus Helarchaeota archaeon]